MSMPGFGRTRFSGPVRGAYFPVGPYFQIGTGLTTDPVFTWVAPFACRVLEVETFNSAMTGTTIAVATTAGSLIGATALITGAKMVIGPATGTGTGVDNAFTGTDAARIMAKGDTLTFTIAHGTNYANLNINALVFPINDAVLDPVND
jgi:hypothetical protein